MEKQDDKKAKIYQKPSWEKQQLFERFTMACSTKSPCGGWYPKRSSYRT